MTRFSKNSILFIIIVAVLLTAGCTPTAKQVSAVQNGTLMAAVSFEAIYEIASAVGGDRVTITKIIPDGAETHHFEPLAKDLAALTEASVFIINGLGLEPWAERAVTASGNERLTVIEASDGIEPVTPVGGGIDMHAWLSLRSAAVMAENICAAFSEADSVNADFYAQNCRDFTDKLEELDNEYTEKFQSVANRTIVTQHAVFGYLCRDYSLRQNSIEGVFAEGEPSAKELAALVDFCRENGIKSILAEELSDPIVSETLAKEAGAELVSVYTIEGHEDGLGYIERMEHNLSTIYSVITKLRAGDSYAGA